MIAAWLLYACLGFSQSDTTTTLTFDFNEGQVKEKDDKLQPFSEGITFAQDRFGNDNSAVYIHGTATSYLNLGSSPLLKPSAGTISLWVNLDRRVYAGKGYDCNPIIGAHNNLPGEDFIVAYGLAYDCYSKHFSVGSTRDSLKEAAIHSLDTARFNTWYHLVFSYNDQYLSFYVNGSLQARSKKGFKTMFSARDSVLLGVTGSLKNERFSQGIFDDIKVFHRVLSDQEVMELYHEPNPNKTRDMIDTVAKYGGILAVFIVIIILMMRRNRRMLQKQKAELDLNRRITELELKVVKAQMNPHFISNCLSAIQDLIYKNELEMAGQYIAKFSFFIRQVLNYSDKTYITLSEEISLLQLNIELEQLRFKNRFSFVLNIRGGLSTDNIAVPSLLTQPLVENAIWHGLLPLKGLRPPLLSIEVYQQGDTVYIEITDNGVGRGYHSQPKARESKGTNLVMSKIESLNRLSSQVMYKLDTTDLTDENGLPAGTRVLIQLINYPEE